MEPYGDTTSTEDEPLQPFHKTVTDRLLVLVDGYVRTSIEDQPHLAVRIADALADLSRSILPVAVPGQIAHAYQGVPDLLKNNLANDHSLRRVEVALKKLEARAKEQKPGPARSDDSLRANESWRSGN